MRVQGPVFAGGFLDVRFSGLRDVVVVGLITCERVVLGKGAKVLRVFVLHIVEEEAEDQVDEKDDRREDRQQEEEGRVAENQTHNMSA